MVAKGAFTIGTDPEFFLSTQRGKYLSAIPFTSGTKTKPEILPNGAGLQWDNVAMEFSTPISSNCTEFITNISSTLKLIRESLPKAILMQFVASAMFPDSELQSDEAQQFGCDPDFNAWTLTVNQKPIPKAPQFRSCGGHIHVGYVQGSGNLFLTEPLGKVDMVKAMDICLGIPSLFLDNNTESKERRSLYGKAGCHRPTEYGVEYRTLSNFWIKTEELISLVYHLTKDAVKMVNTNQLDHHIMTLGETAVPDAINNGIADKDMLKYIKKYGMSPTSTSLFNQLHI